MASRISLSLTGDSVSGGYNLDCGAGDRSLGGIGDNSGDGMVGGGSAKDDEQK